MSLQQRKNLYGKAVVDNGERNLKELRIKSNDYFCKYEIELIELTNNIPNWESYLTDQQVKILKLYLNYRNVSDVTHELGWQGNSVYNILFGNYQKGKDYEMKGGILKKLRSVNEKLIKIRGKKDEQKKM